MIHTNVVTLTLLDVAGGGIHDTNTRIRHLAKIALAFGFKLQSVGPAGARAAPTPQPQCVNLSPIESPIDK